MSRPRTPTNVLELRGAFEHDPARGREREGEPDGSEPIGDPPEGLTPERRAAWDEIVGACHPGVLCRADRVAVYVAACLFADFNANPSGFAAARLARLDSLLGRFGMTPADRSRVKVIGKPKVGRLAGLRDAG